MSFNGGGTYSLPSGNPVVTGTSISSTWANLTLQDIASALTNTMCKDGQSTPTANIKMGGFKLTGLAQGTAVGDALAFEQATLKTGSTGSAQIPAGTTAQRDASPALGYLRYNSTDDSFEGYKSTGWGSIGGGGGATGSGKDAVFVENEMDVTQSFVVGQSGQTTCTISIASPAVITQTNSYVAGQRIFFRTTGALPTGLSANQVYYVSATGLSTSSFQVSATQGGASINTSGTQSGSHTCGKLKSAEVVGPLWSASGVVITVPSGAKLVVS